MCLHSGRLLQLTYSAVVPKKKVYHLIWQDLLGQANKRIILCCPWVTGFGTWPPIHQASLTSAFHLILGETDLFSAHPWSHNCIYLWNSWLVGQKPWRGSVCWRFVLDQCMLQRRGWLRQISFLKQICYAGHTRAISVSSKWKPQWTGCGNISNSCVNKLNVLNKNNKTEGLFDLIYVEARTRLKTRWKWMLLIK